MLNRLDLYNRLIFVAKEKYQHPHYEHVTKLAKKYLALMTGKGSDDLLKQFNIREDAVLFDQRKRITQLITPCIVNSLMIPQKKVPQVKPVVKEAGYAQAERSNKNRADLWTSINGFFAGNDVDYYLKEKLISLSNHDPNAFAVVTFKNVDTDTTRPPAYAYEVPCDKAVDFEYENGILSYLVERNEIKYAKFSIDKLQKKEKDTPGKSYLIHGEEDNIKLTQVDASMASASEKDQLFIISGDGIVIYIDPQDARIGVDYHIKFNQNEMFQVNFYEPKSKGVPAFRVGYLLDPDTNYTTCVNHWHAALPRLMKTVKTVSELDLSSSLHVFPKLITYVDRCPGADDVGCKNGSTPDGETCEICHGTGDAVHTSSQDVITYRKPKSTEDWMDLSKLHHYVVLPIDIITWMREYINENSIAAYQDIYNSDVYAVNSLVKTATEVTIKSQSVIDALMPLFSWYSSSWKFLVQKIAIYRSIDKSLTVEHQFPKRPSFDTIADLLALMSAAKTAGAPQSVLNEYSDQIVEQQLADRPLTLKRYKTEQSFDPFKGKSPDVIPMLLASQYTLPEHCILWINLQPILQQAERDYIAEAAGKKDVEFVSFHDVGYDEQKKFVDAVLLTYTEKFDEKKEEERAIKAEFSFNDPVNQN